MPKLFQLGTLAFNALKRASWIRGLRGYKTPKKPNSTKSPKPKDKPKKSEKVKGKQKKRKFFGWLFGDDQEDVAKPALIVEKKLQKAEKENKPLKYEYQESRFSFKRKKFSEDKKIDDSMNYTYKETQHRTHRIEEIRKRISVSFFAYLEDRKRRLLDNIPLKDYFDEDWLKNLEEKDKNSGLGGLFFGKGNKKPVPKKPKKPKKPRIRTWTRKFLRKHPSLRKPIVKTRLFRRAINQRIINPVKNTFDTKIRNPIKEAYNNRVTKPLNRVKKSYNNLKAKIVKKVTDPFGVRTKISQYLDNKRQEVKNYLNTKKEQIKTKIKNKVKNIPDDLADHANKKANQFNKPDTKTSDIKTSSDLGEVGEDLEKAKKIEIDAENELKAKEAEAKAKEQKLRQAEENLQKARKNAKWYQKVALYAEEKAIAFLRNSMSAYNWLSDKAARAKAILDKGVHLTKSFTDKISKAKKQAPKLIGEFFSLLGKYGLKGLDKARPVLKRIPLIGQVLLAALTLFDLSKARTKIEVRNIIGRGIGGIVGAMIGAIGMVLGPIVGFITTMVVSFIGEWIGEQLSYFGVEPIDFIPFDKYDAPVEEKIQILKEGLKDNPIPSLFFNEEIFEEATKSGKYLENPGENVESLIANSLNSAVETTFNTDINEDGKINNLSSSPSQTASNVKPVPLNASQQDVLKLLDQVGSEVGVNPLILKSIAASESGLKPTAQNPNATADGLFQMLNGTWNEMAKKYGQKYGIPTISQRGGIKLDARANALMGGYLIKENLQVAAEFVSPLKPVDAYIPHFLGHGGARKFYRGLKNNPNELGYLGLASSPADGVVKHNLPYWRDKKTGQWYSKAGTYKKMANTLASKIAVYGLSSSSTDITDASLVSSSENTQQGNAQQSNTQQGNINQQGSVSTSYSVSGELGDESVVKAANIARKRAHGRSTGYCARYVKTALNQAGFPYLNGHAYQLHRNGELKKIGFEMISSGTQGYSAQVGDVVVIDAFGKHKYGHVAIFDGKNWISDFLQRSINIYKDLKSDSLLKLYRFSGNLDNDAEEKTGAKTAKGSDNIQESQKITKNVNNTQVITVTIPTAKKRDENV